MKKTIALGMVIMMLAGCNSAPAEQTHQEPEQQQVQEEPMSFEKFEKILTDNGLTISETTDMAADMLGAEQGKKYTTDDGSFELYKFDKSSDAYKKAESDGVVTLEGFGDFNVTVNDGFALLANDNETITEEFAK